MISTKKTNAIFCNENQLKLTQGKKKKEEKKNAGEFLYFDSNHIPSSIDDG
jgi:hypothetical protein